MLAIRPVVGQVLERGQGEQGHAGQREANLDIDTDGVQPLEQLIFRRAVRIRFTFLDLIAQDERPDQTEDQLELAVDWSGSTQGGGGGGFERRTDIFGTNVHKLDLLTFQKLEREEQVVDLTDG